MRSPTVCCLLAILATGCSADDRQSSSAEPPSEVAQTGNAPNLQLLGRTSLEENDSAYVARPAGVVIGTDGSIFVSDAFWGRVLRFSSDGALMATYGRRGEGPGELKDPGAVSVHGRELLVADVGLSRLLRFELSTGRNTAVHTHRGLVTSITPGERGVWLGVQNLSDTTAVGWLADGAVEPEYLGRLPAEFLASPPLAGIFTGVEVVTSSDTVVAGFMGLNRLRVMRSDGTVLQELRIPARERKGELPDVVSALRTMEYPAMFASSSALFRMYRLPSGSLALIYYDQTIDGELIQSTAYLSLLSADLTRACVDRKIPLQTDAQPYTAFAGDQLFVLQQRVEGESATTFVDRYRIDEGTCFQTA